MKTWVLGAALALASPYMAACERDEGPLEETGEQLEETGEKVDEGLREGAD